MDMLLIPHHVHRFEELVSFFRELPVLVRDARFIQTPVLSHSLLISCAYTACGVQLTLAQT